MSCVGSSSLIPRGQRLATVQCTSTWVLAATVLGSSMEFLDGTVVNIALPSLQHFYRSTAIQTEWVVAGYAIALSSLLLPLGVLGDKLGQRKLFGTGILVFALASCWCAAASTISHLLLARFVQGVGGAALVANSLAFLSKATPPEKRVKAIGTWSALTSLMIASGPILGGWLVQAGSWRWVFLLNVPPAAVALWITFAKTGKDTGAGTKDRLDLRGTVLVIAAVAAIAGGLLQIDRTPRHAIVALLSGLLCMLVFVKWETKTPAPLLPLDLFRKSVFRRANLLTFLLYGALAPLFYYLPLKLIQTENYTPRQAGAATLPLVITLTLVSQFTGRLTKAFSAGHLLTMGPCLAGVGFLLLGQLSGVERYWIALAPGLFLIGVGVAVTVPPLTNLALTSSGDQSSGVASGVNNTMAQVASLFTLAASTPIFLHMFADVLRSRLTTSVGPQESASIWAQRGSLGSIITVSAAGKAVVRQAFAHSFAGAATLSFAMACAAGLVGFLISRAATNTAPAADSPVEPPMELGCNG